VEPGGGTLLSASLVAWPPGWAADVAVGFELADDPDDPPHAVSSRASEPRPAAAAKPLLRITTLHSRFSVLWVHRGPSDPPDATDLPRAFRTADLRLIHAADCCSMY